MVRLPRNLVERAEEWGERRAGANLSRPQACAEVMAVGLAAEEQREADDKSAAEKGAAS